MTDMVVLKDKCSLDKHTSDKRATSGYTSPSLYHNLRMILLHKCLTHDLYDRYNEGFVPIMPVFLVRWSDD